MIIIYNIMINYPNQKKHPWDAASVAQLFDKPFMDLIFEAASVHRAHFNPNQVQRSTLLSIKTGRCPEDCAYCPQSAHHHTELDNVPLMPLDEVIQSAKAAKANGATRFCMGAAWRSPPREQHFAQVLDMVQAVKAEGLESCMTLGMLNADQATRLKAAGLDYYNHNLDTSEAYYAQVITTRTYQDRLDTLAHVRNAGIHVCCGGILGMGESRQDRMDFLLTLAHLPKPPESVPINQLVRVPGTPLDAAPEIDPFEFIRTIAVARLMMPTSFVRLSAGRNQMSETMQALCFLAGANSIFYGDALLTTENNAPNADDLLFDKLGMTGLPLEAVHSDQQRTSESGHTNLS